MGDDPEVVGDGFRDRLPFVGQRFVEECEDRFGELAEVRMEAVVRHVAVHDAPQTLDGVQVRRIGWQEVQPDAAPRPLQERLERLRVMVAGVVQEDMDHPAVGMGALQLPQKPQARPGIDPLALHQREPHRLQVQRPVQVQAPPAGRRPDGGPVLADEPAMRRPALPFGVDRVGEDDRLVGEQPAHQLLVAPDEGFLGFPVGLPRKRFRLDVLESQPVHQLDRAAAGVFDAVALQDGGPDLVGVTRRAVPEHRPERGLLAPGQLALPFRIRRRVQRGEARPAELPQPAAHRVGVEMENPADEADAVPVVKRNERVRAPHLERRNLAPAHDRKKRIALRGCQDGTGPGHDVCQ